MIKKICISVIVPFYNAKSHLKTCLEVLLKQDFNEPFEIIMVDDASHDNSQDIIKMYNSSNIRLYTLDSNSGPSAARNLGLKKAKGEYIYFLDVDDTIASNTLTTLYNVLNEKNYDLVFSDKKWIQNSKNQRNDIFDYSADQTFDNSDISELMKTQFHNPNPVSSGMLFGLTGRLIRRSIISDNKILFEKKLRFLEDETFIWDVLAFVRSARYVRNQLYSYYIEHGVSTESSNGIKKSFSVSNLKIVKTHIQNSLKKCHFPNKEIEKIGDQGFIFLLIAALVSYSRSALQGKVDLKDFIKTRGRIIDEALSDPDVLKAIQNYSCSKKESSLIPRAIAWRSRKLLAFACTRRAKEILRIREK